MPPALRILRDGRGGAGAPADTKGLGDRQAWPAAAGRRHDRSRLSAAGLALIAATALAGCSGPIDAYDGAPRPDGEVATVLGGGFPNLHAIDGREIVPDPLVGRPDARVPAGRHTLVIDYQPCANANSCGLAAMTAEVVLRARRTYGVHHETAGCTAWDALTGFARRHETPCRDYLWIADRASGEAIWGTAPPPRVD